jgi:hypothetical protein
MEIQEPPKEIWDRKKLNIELRQRYELYFAALIFTLTGLSIQTAKPYATPSFVWAIEQKAQTDSLALQFVELAIQAR